MYIKPISYKLFVINIYWTSSFILYFKGSTGSENSSLLKKNEILLKIFFVQGPGYTKRPLVSALGLLSCIPNFN